MIARLARVLVVAGVSALSGVLLGLALPPSGVSLLGWVAFAPLFIATRRTTPAYAAACGLLTAAVAVSIMAKPIETPSDSGGAVFVLGALSMVLIVVAVVSAAAAGRFSLIWWVVLASCAAVATEFLSGSVTPVVTAASQHDTDSALLLAGYTGVWGVSFALWLVSASIAAFISAPRQAWVGFVVALVIVAGIAGWSPDRTPSGRTLSVAAVQAPDGENAAEETRRLAGRTDVVVWPEHLLVADDPTPFDSARESRVYVVASATEQSEKWKPYNSACIVSPDGKRLGGVRKRHLFGDEIRYYTRGNGGRPIKCRNLNAGIAICYDTVFTDVIRTLARQGADVAFVPTHDPEMTNSLINHMHTASTQFRAAENGIPIVWADANSLSSIFDSDGRRVARAPAHSITSVRGTVHLRNGRTLYSVLGDYFAHLCLGVTFIALLVEVRRGLFRRRKRRSAELLKHEDTKEHEEHERL